MDRKLFHAAVHGVAKTDMTEQTGTETEGIFTFSFCGIGSNCASADGLQSCYLCGCSGSCSVKSGLVTLHGV